MRPSVTAIETTYRAESDPIMPASKVGDVQTNMPPSKDGDVQTDKSDGRKFITIRVASNSRFTYRRIYLKTTNHRLARQRARTLETIEDPEEARRIVTYLASAKTPGQENDRLAELTDTMPKIPSLSHDEARKELETLQAAAERNHLPLTTYLVFSKLNDTFWANLIGRGYPSPNTQFRWCTDHRKIHPVSDFIKSVVDRVREAA